MTRCKKLSILIASALLLSASFSIAQEAPSDDSRSGRDKTLDMVRTATPPLIDGVMDEVWSTGALIDDLHQTDPIEYAQPSEKTIVRILYDEDFLYLSAMMYYVDPSKIIANKLIQGSNLRFDDKFRVYINPFNDGRNGYIFQTNANGVRTDGILENVTDNNFDWTGTPTMVGLSRSLFPTRRFRLTRLPKAGGLAYCAASRVIPKTSPGRPTTAA